MDFMKYFQVGVTSGLVIFFMLQANTLSDAVLPVVVGLLVQTINLINDKRKDSKEETKQNNSVKVTNDYVVVTDEESVIEVERKPKNDE